MFQKVSEHSATALTILRIVGSCCLESQACRVRLQKTTIQSEHVKRWAVPWTEFCAN